MKATTLGIGIAIFCTISLGVGGCAAPVDEPVGRGVQEIIDTDEASYIAGMSDDEQAGIVAFVNAAETTRERLDVTCGLHADAAKHIDRTKSKYGPYTSVQAIADTQEVGVYNLDLIVRCAEDFGYVTLEIAPLDAALYVIDGTASCLVYRVEISGEAGYEASWEFSIYDFQRTGTVLLGDDGVGYGSFCAPYDLDYFAGQYSLTLDYTE